FMKHELTLRFFAGDPLASLEEASEQAARFAERAGSLALRDRITSMHGLVQRLRSVSGAASHFGEAFDDRTLPLAAFHYLEHEIAARLLLGDYDDVVRIADRAERLIPAAQGFLEVAELHFYAAL